MIIHSLLLNVAEQYMVFSSLESVFIPCMLYCAARCASDTLFCLFFFYFFHLRSPLLADALIQSGLPKSFVVSGFLKMDDLSSCSVGESW